MNKLARLTQVTSAKPERLTKLWCIEDGKPTKKNAGEMVHGEAQIVQAESPVALVKILNGIQSNQALIFGLPPTEKCPVVTSENLPRAALGSIARTQEFFAWNDGPGWMLLDGDPIPGNEPLTRDEFLDLLFEVAPSIKNAPMAWGVSGSSFIFDSERQQQITELRGQRVYLLVDDARDIPRAGKALSDRLWLAGYGRFIVSKAGSLLPRTPVDTNVWQSNRLDFAAPPVCTPPLEARRPNPVAINNASAPLVTAEAIPDLSVRERSRLSEIKSAEKARDDFLSEIRQKKDAWINDRLAALANATREERDEARHRLLLAVEKQRLFGDFKLIHSSGELVTVEQMLSDPDRWHGQRFHDPLEPDYSNSDRRIAWANLKSGTAPTIYSHAHGGTRYRLMRQLQQIRLQQGDMPELLPQVMERLRLDGEIFERGGNLARIADGDIIDVEKSWLQTHLESVFQFQAFDSRSSRWVSRDCPDKLAMRLLAARGDWGLPKVGAVVTFPVMRPDGSVISEPGFDVSTSLLYLNQDSDRQVLQSFDKPALIDALVRIWRPFSEFSFDGDTSRGVFLSALLTTVCRQALPTAPAFLIRAYTPGSGKTLLSECLMLLVGARPSALPMPDKNAEEVEKRLFSKLLTGCPGFILDNLVGVVDNAAMCAFLTSSEPEGRMLGLSEIRRVSNRTLWVLNGNNVTAGGDTFRRILPITLDANCESPESRRFTFNPKVLIEQQLDQYRADLLNVLRAYQDFGSPLIGDGSFGSFEQWESLVRQCVCWLISEGITPAEMGDPLEVMSLSKLEDPSHLQHAEILESWYRQFANRIVQVAEIKHLFEANSFGSTAEEQAFCEAIMPVALAHGRFNGRMFGGWLRKNKGRVVNGFRLDPGPSSSKQPGWRVRQVPS